VLRLPASLGRLTPRSPHHRAGPVSYRRHSWGSPFRGLFLPIAGRASRHPLPLLAFACRPRGRSESSPTPAVWCVGPSPPRIRVAVPRRARPGSRSLGGTEPAWHARTQPVASAPSGVPARIGSPCSGRRVLPRTMGADPLLGFQPSRGFPRPAWTTADAASPLVRFRAGVPRQTGRGRFRVSIGWEVGWSLSRLPPLLGFLSSSREPSSELTPWRRDPGVGDLRG
jgi:hypothetical protein